MYVLWGVRTFPGGVSSKKASPAVERRLLSGGAAFNQSSNTTLLPVRLQWAAGSYDGSRCWILGRRRVFRPHTGSPTPDPHYHAPPHDSGQWHSMDNHFLTSPILQHLSHSSHRATTRRLGRFFIIDSPLAPVVLGHSWLVRHNPRVNWGQNSVSEWSERCYASCLVSACSPVSCVSLQDEAVNLSNVPEEYLDLKEVFSKSRAASLPPHRPYDCAIDLVPGTSPPKGRLYSLSVPEREAMEKYISDSLAAGLIRPSSSPAGAGFFSWEEGWFPATMH